MNTTLDTIEFEAEELRAAEEHDAWEYEKYERIILQTEYDKVINRIRSHSMINL